MKAAVALKARHRTQWSVGQTQILCRMSEALCVCSGIVTDSGR